MYRGYIPFFLRKQLAPTSAEPYPWHLNLADEFKREGVADLVLVINLKPNSKENLKSLFELVEVWGHSNCNWTPIMIYIRGLVIDGNSEQIDDMHFSLTSNEIEDPIFSMMYLQGTVKNGELIGRWTPPGPSPTNSVLLWPDVLERFYQESSKVVTRVQILGSS